MTVDVTRLLRSCCHVCLLLSFSHAIGLLVSRDVNQEFSAGAPIRNIKVLLTATSPYDVTQTGVVRRTAKTDDVIENATQRPRLRRKAGMSTHRLATLDDGSPGHHPTTAWSQETAARALQELEQDLTAARDNCSRTSVVVQSLNVELPGRVLGRFSVEAAGAVHAANVVSLLLRSEVTSRGNAFLFSLVRAVLESSGEWVGAATLVVERPGRAVVGPQAARFSPRSSVPDLRRVNVSDVGRAEWYDGLVRRGRGRTGRCGGGEGEEGWVTTGGGRVLNRSSVVSDLTDVLWSTPYVVCPTLAMVSLIVPIYSCDQRHNIVIRSAPLIRLSTSHSVYIALILSASM